MTLLYNRFAEVRFLDRGKSLGGRRELIGEDIRHPHSIGFNVRHTSKSEPNDAEISIVNLDPDSQRDLLEEGERIELECGYWPQGGVRSTGVIFSGRIREASTDYSAGVEHVTRIICGDGDRAFTRARVRQVFSAGATHQEIVEALVGSMAAEGVSRGTVRIPAFSETRPRSIDRVSRREFDDIAHQHDLQWSIQDGFINIYPRSEPIANTQYTLTPDTGLLGVPEFSDKGASLETLLIHDLRPGQLFKVNSDVRERLISTCKIEDITFRGDSFDGDFGCQINARLIEGGTVKRSDYKEGGLVT